jgi:Ran GTPase-activating protein (RanGAP) involved in mRNA processing and transport
MSAKFIATMASLHGMKSVELDYADVTAENALALAEALKVNTSVTDIDLDGNEIGDEGASALANALKVNTSLTFINLMSNQIGNEGAASIADALEGNKSVTTIYLNENGIGAEGALAIADALNVNTTVTNIDLGGNDIDDEGASALADALKGNTSVTYISLFNNAIDESNLVNVNALVARNKRLRCLFLFDARRMLLSLMCADECGVVWPYLLGSGNTDGVVAPDNVESIRAEFSEVVAERRRRSQASPEAKRRRLE